jgi:hypothetical protein
LIAPATVLLGRWRNQLRPYISECGKIAFIESISAIPGMLSGLRRMEREID